MDEGIMFWLDLLSGWGHVGYLITLNKYFLLLFRCTAARRPKNTMEAEERNHVE